MADHVLASLTSMQIAFSAAPLGLQALAAIGGLLVSLLALDKFMRDNEKDRSEAATMKLQLQIERQELLLESSRLSAQLRAMDANELVTSAKLCSRVQKDKDLHQ